MTPLRRIVHVETRRGIIEAEYRPGDLTLADIYDGDPNDPHGAACRLIVSCVARWTIADRDGARFPITTASVRRLNPDLVRALAAAIIADYRLVVAEQARANA